MEFNGWNVDAVVITVWIENKAQVILHWPTTHDAREVHNMRTLVSFCHPYYIVLLTLCKRDGLFTFMCLVLFSVGLLMVMALCVCCVLSFRIVYLFVCVSINTQIKWRDGKRDDLIVRETWKYFSIYDVNAYICENAHNTQHETRYLNADRKTESFFCVHINIYIHFTLCVHIAVNMDTRELHHPCKCNIFGLYVLVDVMHTTTMRISHRWQIVVHSPHIRLDGTVVDII